MGYSGDRIQDSSKKYGLKKPSEPGFARDAAMNEKPKSTQTKGWPDHAGFTDNSLRGGDGGESFSNGQLEEGDSPGLGVRGKTQVPQFSHVEDWGGRDSMGGSSKGTGKPYANKKSGATGRP